MTVRLFFLNRDYLLPTAQASVAILLQDDACNKQCAAGLSLVMDIIDAVVLNESDDDTNL